MKKAIFLNLAALVFTLSFLSACNNSHQDLPVATSSPAPKPEVQISEISSNKCLNLEKLNAELKNPQFAVPAAIMTTNFKPLNDISHDKTEFFSYASFYYKVTQANELNLFTAAHQDDCKTIQLLTASNEILTYDITDHSEQQITFTLSDIYNENIPDYEKKVIANRIEPYEYTVTYVAANRIQVTEKFSSIDPLCDKKTILKFQSTKDIAWAPTVSGLPTTYSVDSVFLGLVQEAVAVSSTPTPPANPDPTPGTPGTPTPPVQPIPGAPAEPVPVPPVAITTFSEHHWDAAPPMNSPATPAVTPAVVTPRAAAEPMTVDQIMKLMTTPLRDELKLCS